MTTAPDSSIHRYLDEAFAGVPLTPDAQDLKEELRASLTARATELIESGVDAREASAKSIAELGDIRDAIGELGEVPAPTTAPTMLDLMGHHRVKPKPAFVLRAVVLSVVLAASIVLLVLSGLSAIGISLGVEMALVAVASIVIGGLVVDGTRQETTMSYALPADRALGFGGSALAAAAGLGLLGAFAGHPDRSWALYVSVVPLVIALFGFTWLGVTQTNRRKAWALEMQREQAASDRFTQDPAAAARFGIYTVIIWVVALAAFAILSIAVGFAWSWVALVAGVAMFFLVLARMLFPAHPDSSPAAKERS